MSKSTPKEHGEGVIRALREELGLSREDFARKAGLNVAVVKRLETKSKDSPKFDVVVALCRASGMSLDEFSRRWFGASTRARRGVAQKIRRQLEGALRDLDTLT